MTRMPLLLSFGMLLSLCLTRSARADQCFVQGGVGLQPMDTYYCDPDVAGVDCTGWKEVDLWDASGGLSERCRTW